MYDDDVRTLFHRIDDGPPLGIDPRDVMSRGHRIRTRRRRLAIAASTAVVAVAVGVTALVGWVVGGDHRPTEKLPPAEQPTVRPTTPSDQGPSQESHEPPVMAPDPAGPPPPVASR